MFIIGKGKLSIGEIYTLAKWTKRIIKQGVEHIKAMRKLTYFTTGDLDENGKLKSDYLKKREQRKKEREESLGTDFYWR